MVRGWSSWGVTLFEMFHVIHLWNFAFITCDIIFRWPPKWKGFVVPLNDVLRLWRRALRLEGRGWRAWEGSINRDVINDRPPIKTSRLLESRLGFLIEGGKNRIVFNFFFFCNYVEQWDRHEKKVFLRSMLIKKGFRSWFCYFAGQRQLITAN